MKGWRTILALGDERLAGILTSTRAWIRGQPESVYGYDAGGKRAKIDIQLVGSENSYALLSEANNEDDEEEWDDEEEDDEWEDDVEEKR